jgi:hypothetical protein
VATSKQESTHFFTEKGNENTEIGTGLFVHKRIISAVKCIEFVSDRLSYILITKRSLASYHYSERSCSNRR